MAIGNDVGTQGCILTTKGGQKATAGDLVAEPGQGRRRRRDCSACSQRCPPPLGGLTSDNEPAFFSWTTCHEPVTIARGIDTIRPDRHDNFTTKSVQHVKPCHVHQFGSKCACRKCQKRQRPMEAGNGTPLLKALLQVQDPSRTLALLFFMEGRRGRMQSMERLS